MVARYGICNRLIGGGVWGKGMVRSKYLLRDVMDERGVGPAVISVVGDKMAEKFRFMHV